MACKTPAKAGSKAADKGKKPFVPFGKKEGKKK